MFCGLNHMRPQAVFFQLVDNTACRQHGHKSRNAKLAGFFGDPVKPVFFDERLTNPKVGGEFAVAQFGVYGQDKVAFVRFGDGRQIFARNIIEQFNRCALFQTHHADQIMGAVAADV